MLVLSRREGEKIIIGDSVAVTIVRLSGEKVRLGIEAPEDVLILRCELEVQNDGHRILPDDKTSQQGLSKPAA